MDSEPTIRNGGWLPLAEIPLLGFADFRAAILDAVEGGGRLLALFGMPLAMGRVRLWALTADEKQGLITPLGTELAGNRYPALTPECTQAWAFECELAEQLGVVPEGHPSLKPLRYHASYRAGIDAWDRPAHMLILPAVTDFFQVKGGEIHEIAVGPVSSGVGEAGHFRFQCQGEDVLHLEIALGFQHRGVERALRGGPDARTAAYLETAAGDTSIGHAAAGCALLESLADLGVPPRAVALRAIALELERLANHAGDLGAMAGDIGFLPTASWCGRIRNDFLSMTALLCGSRFGRGLIRPGGVLFDVDDARIDELLRQLDAALRGTQDATDFLWNTPSVLSRLEGIGTLTPELADDLGMVGVAARACGIGRDVRTDFPAGAYSSAFLPAAVWKTGDVYARAKVRWLEMQLAGAFIRDRLLQLPSGPVLSARAGGGVTPPVLSPNRLAVSLVEGWRGEICHVGVTGENGRLRQYKIIDPSFRNWIGLAMAMRNQQLSDFPLCNKSFNLSYCGFDL